jgi:hypothetical protein
LFIAKNIPKNNKAVLFARLCCQAWIMFYLIQSSMPFYITHSPLPLAAAIAFYFSAYTNKVCFAIK